MNTTVFDPTVGYSIPFTTTTLTSSTIVINAEPVYALVLKQITNVFSYSTRAFELFIIIFLTAQYFIKKSKFASAYFLILNIGYIIDVLSMTYRIYPFNPTNFVVILMLCEWYTIYFVTFWNIILCFNRCTALVFYSKYEKIWIRYTMIPIIILMLFFPFIIDGNNLFSSNCSFQNWRACYPFREQYYFKGTIINVSSNCLMFAIITASMWFSRKDLQNLSIHAKTERRLIYQAIFSSFLLFISFALKFASSFTINQDSFYFFTYSSNIGYYIHHLVVIISHFILSPSFKNAFFKFYRLKFLIRKPNNISRLNTKGVPSNMSVIQI